MYIIYMYVVRDDGLAQVKRNGNTLQNGFIVVVIVVIIVVVVDVVAIAAASALELSTLLCHALDFTSKNTFNSFYGQ